MANMYYYSAQMNRVHKFEKSTGTISPNMSNFYTETNKKLNATIQAEFKKVNSELAVIKQNIVNNDMHLDEAVSIVKDNILVSNAKITSVNSTCSKINTQLQVTVDNNNSIQNLNTDNLNEIKKQLISLDKKLDLLLSKI